MPKIYIDQYSDNYWPQILQGVFGDKFDQCGIDQAPDYIFITALDLSVDQDIDKKLQKLTQYANAYKKVFVIDTELNLPFAQIIDQFPLQDNVYWVIPGLVQGKTNTIFYGWHLHHTIQLYQNTAWTLEKYKPYAFKPLLFDALLGTKKNHRDFIEAFLNHVGLILQTKLKYHGNYGATVQDPGHFAWPEGCENFPDTLIQTSTESVLYHGHPARLSQIIPVDVYMETAYSIVAESFVHNEYSFFTEKIAKPILAHRLFVVFSGQHYLRNLRSLGFRTFDGIIDEGYDNIEDNAQRFRMAGEQLIYLGQQDQQHIFDQIKLICEHNYNLLLSLESKLIRDLTRICSQ